MKFIFSALIFVITLSALTSCVKDGDGEPDVENYITIGSTVPDFTVYDLAGGSFSSEEFADKRTLLVFFALDCPYCREELPLIEELWKLTESDHTINIVAISRKDEPLDEYWTTNNLTMPKYADRERTAYNLFANSVVPRFYIIDAQRKVEWMNIGSLPEKITAVQLEEMLSGDSQQ